MGPLKSERIFSNWIKMYTIWQNNWWWKKKVIDGEVGKRKIYIEIGNERNNKITWDREHWLKNEEIKQEKIELYEIGIIEMKNEVNEVEKNVKNKNARDRDNEIEVGNEKINLKLWFMW